MDYEIIYPRIKAVPKGENDCRLELKCKWYYLKVVGSVCKEEYDLTEMFGVGNEPHSISDEKWKSFIKEYENGRNA